MAASNEAPSEIVNSVRFSFYTPEDIRKLSAKKITSPDLLDAKGTPIPNGLYDPALGPINEINSCKTCGQLAFKCSGHCGHIDLVKPLYNPLLFNSLKSLLHITCFFCHKFRFNEQKIKQYVAELTHIARGDILSAKELEVSSLCEVFFSEDSKEGIDIKESSADISSCELAANSNDTKQKNGHPYNMWRLFLFYR